jgi:hypothetical protein
VEQAEAMLRHEVCIIWKKFREGVINAKQEMVQTPCQLDSRSRDGNDSPVAAKCASPGNQAAPVAIRDFVPVSNRLAKSPPTTHISRISSLSASLATSSFHHPAAQQEQTNSRLDEGLGYIRPDSTSPNASSISSSASRTLSSQSGGSTTSSSLRPKAEGSRLPEPFKRSMDQTRDTAVSFQYFTILEADAVMARAKRKAEETNRDVILDSSSSGQASRGRSEVIKTIANENEQDRKHSTRQNPEEGKEDSRERKLKGKRKVTFDIQPDVVTIKREADADGKEGAAAAPLETGGTTFALWTAKFELMPQSHQDMIFDLEDEGSERSFSEPASRPVLPLNEPLPARPRVRRNRVSSNVGLPESLYALRPTSLPLPTHIRPPSARHGIDTSLGNLQGSSRQDYPKKSQPERSAEDPEPLNAAEAEILKLVAAHAPSHRGAWNRDSKAWQLFVRRQDGRTGLSSIIPEEGEVEDDSLAMNGITEDGDEVNELYDLNSE